MFPIDRILPHIRGNVGFVFTKSDLVEVREKLLENKVQAPARANAIAPCAVVIPAQNTGLGPEKTSFFQALSIPTKISKGSIEIIVSIDFCSLLIIPLHLFPEFLSERCADFERRRQSWSFRSDAVEHAQHLSFLLRLGCSDGLRLGNYI